jgi:hypothetical protein
MEESPDPVNKQVLTSCGVLMLAISAVVVLAVAASALYLTLAR